MQIRSEKNMATTAPAIVEVDDASFDETVLRLGRPWVVNFGAPWCPPCHALQPAYDRLSREYADRLGFARVNADESPRLVARYGVQGVPTLVFFARGTMTGRHVGPSPARLKEVLDRALAEMGA
jgi:thioredoxin 1